MMRVIWTIAYMLLGALLFWIPDLIIHVRAGANFSGTDVGTVTLVVTAITICSIYGLYKYKSLPYHSLLVRSMIIGIWIFGGLAMSISTGLCGGKFSWIMALLGALPPYTFIMSTYDGSLGALLFVTGPSIYLAAKSRNTQQSAPADGNLRSPRLS